MQTEISGIDLRNRLISLANNGSLPHTLIIEGGEAFVRKQVASELCMAFVCTDKSDAKKPCKGCNACKRAGAGEHPDAVFAEEFAKNNNRNTKGTVSVDDVRKIKTEAYIMPYEAENKIFVFENAHRLNEQSQNALLKLLEEPPAGVYFVFLCPSAKMLLQTVRSRAAIFSAGKLAADDSENYIRSLFPDADENIIRKTARLYIACDGLEPEKLEQKWLENAFSNAQSFFKNGILDSVCLNKKSASGDEYKLLFNVLAMGARDIMLCGAGSSRSETYEYALLDANEISSCPFTMKSASELYSLFTSAAERLGENANPTSVLSLIAAQI